MEKANLFQLKEVTNMAVATCPDCGNEISLGPKPKEGQTVTCPDCGADLEVISLDPLELDWAYSDVEEEWDTSDDDWD
jgi:alpha-aminoadipate carrier protein LysW